MVWDRLLALVWRSCRRSGALERSGEIIDRRNASREAEFQVPE